MRIWSLHPKYLDAKGLVALWRETLLAKNVLLGNTKGYRNHPQLLRFKNSSNPVQSINYYLQIVWEEARSRNYNFNADKFKKETDVKKIPVTKGQVQFEFLHLLNKLQRREVERYDEYKDSTKLSVHPLFNIIEGNIEQWEKI